MKEKLILLAIFLIGLFLRVYQLDSFPVGLHIDEAEVGYNAYSLALTGKDELGNFLPTHLNIFGFSRPEQVFYITAPFVKLFSLSEVTTRLPTALVGALSIIAIYFLSFSFFGKKSISYMVAGLLAITPWHIIFSRATSEGILEVFWMIITIYFLLIYVRKKKVIYLLGAYITSVLTMYAYLPSRLLLPLLILGFITIFIKEIHTNRKVFFSVLIFFCVFLVFPTFFLLQDNTGLARFKQVSIFSSPETQLILEEEIREDSDKSNRFLTRLFHNKPVKYLQTFTQNYQEYFTISFLSMRGGLPTRFVIPNTGGLYLIEIPFLFFGLFMLVKQKKKEYFFIIFWFLVAPVTASLTFEDSPNMQRSMNMVIPATMIVGYGMVHSFMWVRKRYRPTLYFGLSMIFLYSILYFSHQYFVHQKTHRPWDRMAEMKEYVSYLNSVEEKYPLIVTTKATTELYIYLLFYNKVDPNRFHKDAHLLNDKGIWKLGKYIFVNRDCASERNVPLRSDILYVDRFTCTKEGGKKYIKEIMRPDNTLGLRVYTIPDVNKFRKAQQEGVVGL